MEITVGIDISKIGLAPLTRQSRQWRGKSRIEGGCAVPRRVLFIGAVVAARYNPALRTFHQRLLCAGKPKRIALIATARKLLTILNAIIRHQKPWQSARPSRQSLPMIGGGTHRGCSTMFQSTPLFSGGG